MKVPIPLDSTLSTDSHPNDIKDPSRDRDLFNNNRSYLYNKYLTNPKKKVIDPEGYITTNGNIIQTTPDGENTHIVHNDIVIADVLSLGVEDVSFLDKDDAVIHDGFLWTVQRILSGYILEQTDLQTQEKTLTRVEQEGIDIVRFVRNTHKVITKNQDGSVTIDGKNYNSINFPGLSEYFAEFNGELAAVEINGKIWFGYNNSAGINNAPSTDTIPDLYITENVNGWILADKIPDQNKSYVINIYVGDNVKIGAGSNGFALDLLTGVTNPMNHTINLHLGSNVFISGRGGNGGSAHSTFLTNGTSGTTAINVGSNINIIGTSGAVIQGGGGGGGAIILRVIINNLVGMPFGTVISRGGGGGAGMSVGQRGLPGGNNGTETTGGSGASSSNSSGRGGNGGNPGNSGGLPLGGPTNIFSNTFSLPGRGGNAIRVIRPAVCTHSGVTLRGGIASV